jgi:hypothetical protein
MVKASGDWTLIAKRLREVHHDLMLYKTTYGDVTEVTKCIVFHTQTEDIPAWAWNLIPKLQKYLDVMISEADYLFENRTDPQKVFVVLGTKDQTLLTRHYLNFIVPSVDAFVEVFHKEHEAKAKRIREQIRSGELDERHRLKDTRLLTSEYRHKILMDILENLRILLDIQENEAKYKIADVRAARRQKQIQDYLISKGIKVWDTKHLKNLQKAG